MKKILLLTSILVTASAVAQQSGNDYWKISERQSIVWNIAAQPLPHSDNIEMAGNRVAAIIYYTVDKSGNLKLERDIIFPQLRTFNKSDEPEFRQYRAYFRHIFGAEMQPNVFHENKILSLTRVDSVEIEGKLVFYHTPSQGIALTRSLFPSMTGRVFVEKWQLKNTTSTDQILSVGNCNYRSSQKGFKGDYNLVAYSDADNEVRLKPGETYTFALYFASGIDGEQTDNFDVDAEEKERNTFISQMKANLILHSPDRVLNTLFYFSKIRAAENIFETKMGLVHSPGGGNYYTGIWANDQVEYSGPFFPFLGYEDGNTAAYNCYKMFLNNIPDNYMPISSSFEMEGELPCCGRDRGDAAMIAFGTSQFALLLGDRQKAQELWPLIEWSLEYCKRKLNEHEVVESTTDEMEGRISTGDANLATSSLYYGGLKFASYLAAELGYRQLAKEYSARMKQMASAIETHFGYNMEGLETYRYFDGNTTLRHWICLPLVMGINDRVEGTSKALLEKLWTENGVLVEYNPGAKRPPVFWDRGTLYALRGIMKAGALDESFDRLEAFSRKRLLGDHVPYVIEAYPENNMRHLSAESALYCRIFIEGLLGFEQEGFNSFSVVPRLPAHFDNISFENIFISGKNLSFMISKENLKLRLVIKQDESTVINKLVDQGTKVTVRLKK